MTPDITMCDRSCPSGHLCYRHTAEPNPHRQAYFASPYPPIVGGRCDYFSPNMVYEAQKVQEQFKALSDERRGLPERLVNPDKATAKHTD